MSERIESTKICFNYKNKDWKLEVTPATLKKMEDMGFSFAKLEQNVVTATEKMFYGTFLEHHPSTSNKLKKEIYDKLKRSPVGQNDDGEDALSETIYSMYNEAIEELTSRGAEGEIEWTVTGG